MKKLSFILILLALVQIVCAQKHEWSSPFVGYSTTKVLTLDKVEFEVHDARQREGAFHDAVSTAAC